MTGPAQERAREFAAAIRDWSLPMSEANLLAIADALDALVRDADTLAEALEAAHERLERIFASRDPELMTQEAYFGMAELDAGLRATVTLSEPPRDR